MISGTVNLRSEIFSPSRKKRQDSEWQRKFLKFRNNNRNHLYNIIKHYLKSLSLLKKKRSTVGYNFIHPFSLIPSGTPSANSKTHLSSELFKKCQENVFSFFLFFSCSFLPRIWQWLEASSMFTAIYLSTSPASRW